MINHDHVRRFLASWFAHSASGELCEVRPLNKKERPLGRIWARAIEEALGHIEQCVAHGDDVYIGALPRRVRGGGADAISSRKWLWADVDYGTLGHASAAAHASREEALEALWSFPLAPAMVVETGGGFHAWWRIGDDPAVDAWSAAIRLIARAVGGDPAVTDAPRILRVAGTGNFKVTPPRAVTLVHLSDERHMIQDFLDLQRRSTPASAPPAAKSVDRPFDRANAVPVLDVLRWLGVEVHAEGPRLYCACPAHRGKNTSQMIVGGERNGAHCFGDCRRFFTPVDLVAATRGCEPREAVNLLAEAFGFQGFASAARPPSPPPELPRARVAEIDDWRAQLAQTSNGSTRNTFGNIVLVLQHHPPFAGQLSYDEMRLTPMLGDRPLADTDVGRMRVQIERDFGFSPAAENVRMAIGVVAEERSFHPVRRYLESLRWDGNRRLERVVPEVLGVREGNVALATTMMRKWFVSAVARAMKPGCKVDTSLVLVGPQRWHKSTFFKTLGGEWFADTYMDITSTDGKLQLHSAWIYEWAELESVTTKKQASDVKQFITSQTDVFRAPYGRAVAHHPRATVIVGTTNEDQFLNDPTGSRRFWIVRVTQRADLRTLATWRDQLWGEAVTGYAEGRGERWWLDEEDEAARELEAESYQVEDPWEAPIAQWLTTPVARKEAVTSARVLTDALDVDVQHQTQGAMNRVGRIMRALGWDNPLVRVGGGRRIRVWRARAGEPAQPE